MLRFIVVALSMFGAYCALCKWLPSAAAIAFPVAGIGITYIMLATLTTGFVTYKIAK